MTTTSTSGPVLHCATSPSVTDTPGTDRAASIICGEESMPSTTASGQRRAKQRGQRRGPAAQIDHPAGRRRAHPRDQIEERSRALVGVSAVLRRVPVHVHQDISTSRDMIRSWPTRWTRSSRRGAANVPTSTSNRSRCSAASAASPRCWTCAALTRSSGTACRRTSSTCCPCCGAAAIRSSAPPANWPAVTHVTSGTMTSRLDRLVARGFVTRRPDPADGRIVRVRLTDAGRERVDAAFVALLRVRAAVTRHTRRHAKHRTAPRP